MTISHTETEKPIEEVTTVAVRFAGDSGDGMQIIGEQFSSTAAVAGNNLRTFPDYPAEIRAPAGTLAGVSGFQVNISSEGIYTPGDSPDVLVAMNPAALKATLPTLLPGTTIIANEDAFTDSNLKKAGYQTNPLQDGSLEKFRLHAVPINRLTDEALTDSPLSPKQKSRCKNFFALGLLSWLYDRPLQSTLAWIGQKFGKLPEVAKANTLTLQAGYNFGITTEMFASHYTVQKAKIDPGTYRKISGNEATALGCIAAAQRAGKTLFYGAYPITPASDILHELCKHKEFNIRTLQAEDEIAAICATLGAAFAGECAVTGTSGPGMALKTETLGLAVMTELPMVIIDVQRGGPSTGLPTKTEQSDLFQAVLGRNGDCPLVVLAAATPGDCFHMAFEAFRIAAKFMTPVILLTDGYLANGAEPWKVPQFSSLPPIKIVHPTTSGNGHPFYPYKRDEETLARPWAIPGTPGLEHRIGGIEKEQTTGNISYDPKNHELMVRCRAEKVNRVANDIPPVAVKGAPEGKLLVVGWGSPYGAITSAVEKAQSEGRSVSSIHLQYIHPFPKNLGDVLRRFETILVPELNMGQLRFVLRSQFLIDVQGFNKIQGQPFKVSEILEAIRQRS